MKEFVGRTFGGTGFFGGGICVNKLLGRNFGEGIFGEDIFG